MAHQLPPLNALRLFEVAGRNCSFKKAADEVNLTPSAISHAVRTLEEWLGTELFERNYRGLALTAFGQSYLRDVQVALEKIAVATSARPDPRRMRPLSCSVAPTFALRWLLPRLPAFRRAHPDIEISIDTSSTPVEFGISDFDLAIRMAPEDQSEELTYLLAVESLIPVAHPDVAQQLGNASDLSGNTLLHVVTVSEDWDAWLKLSGAELPADCRHMRFDRIHMALDAAARGIGVAIGRLPLVASDLEDGRLVPVLGPERKCGTGYWLALSEGALKHPGAQAFKSWITSELTQD